MFFSVGTGLVKEGCGGEPSGVESKTGDPDASAVSIIEVFSIISLFRL